MIRFITSTILATSILTAAAVAQTTPVAAPSPAASPTPSVIGPPLGTNDPCTTLSAIVTRPTVTNAVCTVRPDHIEIETGYQNVATRGKGNTITYPQAVIRVGTRLSGLELQVQPPQFERTTDDGVTSGNTDIGAGLKYVLGYSSHFSWSVQANFTGPTGSAAFGAGTTTSTYALQASYIVNQVFSLSGGVQDQLLATNGTRYGSFVPTLVLTAALPNATGAYAEAAQFTHAQGAGTSTRTQYIAGGYRDLGQRVQLDLEYGFSPTASTDKYHYVGAGISYYL